MDLFQCSTVFRNARQATRILTLSLAVYFKADVRNIYFRRDSMCCFIFEEGLKYFNQIVLNYYILNLFNVQTISRLINLQSNRIFSWI